MGVGKSMLPVWANYAYMGNGKLNYITVGNGKLNYTHVGWEFELYPCKKGTLNHANVKNVKLTYAHVGGGKSKYGWLETFK